jgi:hypothetical protein
MCKYNEQLARLSINPQVVRPTRVILGISVTVRPSKELEDCLDDFREMLDVPLHIVYKHTNRGSAGINRNIALSALHDNEGALLHDDDEYVHPQAIQFVMRSFAKYPDDNVLLMSYLYGWHDLTSASPWCLKTITAFDALQTTTDITIRKHSTNVDINSLLTCRTVHHGYPAFRYSPITQYNLKYNTHQNRGEDGEYIQSLVRANAAIRYTCFPVVAYRSHLPTLYGVDIMGNVCDCYAGLAKCIPII